LIPRQALHAKTLGFEHPKTGEWMQFDSEIPQDLVKTLGNPLIFDKKHDV